MATDLWNHEAPIIEIAPDIDIPAWIAQDISPSDVAAITQGGCASGAYMPAVAHHKASATMGEHGDDVLNYIEGVLGELPPVPAGTSWSGTAVFYLSYAVELWASGVEQELQDALADLEGGE